MILDPSQSRSISDSDHACVTMRGGLGTQPKVSVAVGRECPWLRGTTTTSTRL